MSNRNFDDLSYNPRGDFTTDTSEYRPSQNKSADIPVGARGADELPTNLNSEREDAEAAHSEATGKVGKGEVQELLSGTSSEERSKTGTRGKKVNAYQQEAALDAQDFDERT
ncbi:hypothetical protein HYDPIDRAFT_113859 [Hydnomerulius pinastri MD-312]|uniref:Uncharacterized protein n=1 Tax=Hydnomerulius pinastri MD-312 TaxID=994086 RepID=A0A0C9WDU7_9AGAM|nr:hypothetical protein HYDPIDRAFT_113859 [Hydnomerulius pinastri MD-312]